MDAIDTVVGEFRKYPPKRAAYRLRRAGARQARRKSGKLPIFDRLALAVSKRRLQACMDFERTIEDAFETPYEYRGVGQYKYLKPMQKKAEWNRLFNRVAADEPAIVVEIGTANGGTLYPWCRTQTTPETVVSVDYGYFGRDLDFYRSFAADSPTKLSLIDANSQRRETADAVENQLDGQAVDFLFIDGDHSYDGVSTDFELYSPLVRDGGLIAFHDIVSPPHISGVGKFWNEIESQYDSEEIIAAENPNEELWNGIGVLNK